MQKIILIFIFFVVTCSCNYKLLVNKDRVYNKRTGYLLFLNRQKFFFPAKHIEANHFFTAKINKPGYVVVFDKEEDALYNAGEKYTIDYEYIYNGEKLFVRDTVRILPVEIGSLPYQLKSKKGIPGNLTIKYNNKIKQLNYYSTNNEAVWSIFPILEKDIQEATDYYNE